MTATSSYRALQVADMTTFMAKLLQKLTEMSCTLANQCIIEHNELLSQQQQSLNQADANSNRINSEYPLNMQVPFEFPESDTLNFTSNT